MNQNTVSDNFIEAAFDSSIVVLVFSTDWAVVWRVWEIKICSRRFWNAQVGRLWLDLVDTVARWWNGTHMASSGDWGRSSMWEILSSSPHKRLNSDALYSVRLSQLDKRVARWLTARFSGMNAEFRWGWVYGCLFWGARAARLRWSKSRLSWAEFAPEKRNCYGNRYRSIYVLYNEKCKLLRRHHHMQHRRGFRSLQEAALPG